MFVIIGVLVVFGAVIGGYLMEHGHLQVLVQPAELVIIAWRHGHMLIANPLGYRHQDHQRSNRGASPQ